MELVPEQIPQPSTPSLKSRNTSNSGSQDCDQEGLACHRHPSSSSALRLIAFYLTQFHPIPENDRWWGKGFTEWANVTKAMPLFDGHLQPHLPTDFGFYDLRVRETRRDQIKVAKEYGIDGFCYHYYWFSGKRLLNQPLDDMLADPESDMPFCLCWANENWTRRWDGAEHEVLIAQKYLPDDDLNFIKSLVPFFQDARYICVDGKPFLIVYCPQHLPDAKRTLNTWREYCRSIGVGELHLCAALTHDNESYLQYGFDSGVEFPPHNLKIANSNDRIRFHEPFRGRVLQYAVIAEWYLRRMYPNSRVFKTIFPSWDNTARTKERALVVLNGVPKNYEFWLSSTLDLAMKSKGDGDQLVFINAWNEWAEGCHLEPDRRFGHGFLNATRDAKRGLRKYTEFPHVSLPDAVGHRFWRDAMALLKLHGYAALSDAKRMIIQRPWLHRTLLPFVRGFRAIRTRVSSRFFSTALRK
ncbi:MAG: glycoside hydrolase family 99-like domain-containing protein [Zoogloeaceae bacterium]|nr:glycoside hydrolase family 99-like domain-containing protein [Zoogloeaceae bacterium]